MFHTVADSRSVQENMTISCFIHEQTNKVLFCIHLTFILMVINFFFFLQFESNVNFQIMISQKM